ncbi:MAG: Maf family protein [Deltaproteobacteria bacterium]
MAPASSLILASASPRRRELLRAVGVPFRVVPSRIGEVPRPGETPLRFVRRAAREKGEEVASRQPDAMVLSADTIVVVEERILGKPSTRREARRMLSLLAGREHLVHTAVCLHRSADGYRDRACITSRVRFRPLNPEEIVAYLRTGESDDKAGAYAAQGAGTLLIERIRGSFTNVVGLPMTQTLAMLLRSGMVRVSRRGPGWYEFAGERT